MMRISWPARTRIFLMLVRALPSRWTVACRLYWETLFGSMGGVMKVRKPDVEVVGALLKVNRASAGRATMMVAGAGPRLS